MFTTVGVKVDWDEPNIMECKLLLRMSFTTEQVAENEDLGRQASLKPSILSLMDAIPNGDYTSSAFELFDY